MSENILKVKDEGKKKVTKDYLWQVELRLANRINDVSDTLDRRMRQLEKSLWYFLFMILFFVAGLLSYHFFLV